jgi:hypothetical protein
VKPEPVSWRGLRLAAVLATTDTVRAGAARRTPVDLGSRPLAEQSFARRVRLALDAGASADQVRDAVRFAAELGVVEAATSPATPPSAHGAALHTAVCRAASSPSCMSARPRFGGVMLLPRGVRQVDEAPH